MDNFERIPSMATPSPPLLHYGIGRVRDFLFTITIQSGHPQGRRLLPGQSLYWRVGSLPKPTTR